MKPCFGIVSGLGKKEGVRGCTDVFEGLSCQKASETGADYDDGWGRVGVF